MDSSNFSQKEEEILQSWESSKIFEKSLERRKDSKLFSFFDGPPFATGLPHYGHILASVIKDLVGRYKTMRGYYVTRRWGWDCHGLPIEHMIEQELKISGKKQIEEIGVGEFNKTCGDAVLKYTKEWAETIRRIARWVEFDNSYKTMDSTYMESVWWAVKQIWDKGLLYKGRKVLLYCPRCETPISNFEVAMDSSYREVLDESVVVKFKVLSEDKFPQNTYLLAWTTTPWTLPGNIALAIKEEIDYVLVRRGSENYVLAKDRLEILDGNYEVIKTMKGVDIVGAQYESLFGLPKSAFKDGDKEKIHHVFPGDFVNTDEGTGVVHIATGYGEEDYNLGVKFGLPIVSTLDQSGVFDERAPEFLRGKYFDDASGKVAEHLEKNNLLYKKDKCMHQYPFCWRCSTPLYYTALPAWFINIQKIKNRLLELNENINWYPEHLKHGRFENGILDAPDWNISRNRYWATPIPIWKCGDKDCGNNTCVGSLDELIKKSSNYGEIYDSVNINEVDLHKPRIDEIKLKCEKCGAQMSRISEVIDCWVESASMPFAEIHYPFENKEIFEKRFPGDFVAEYIAQTRAWFYVMHVVSAILFDKAPFKHVVTTGTILNEKGEKLSKSKKNYPDSSELIGKYGVDALRFYMMSSSVMKGENLFFSEKEVDDAYKKIILILKNVVSFYKLYPDSTEEKVSVKNILDKWILSLLNKLIRDGANYVDRYDVIVFTRMVREFIDDLSTWYLRRSRDRFKNQDLIGISVFRHVLIEFSKIIAPVMPFLAEHVYKEAGGEKESVHLEDWPQADSTLIDEDLEENMEKSRETSALALSIRDENNIKVRQPLKTLVLNSNLGEEFLSLIKDEVNVKEILVEDKPDSRFIIKQDGELAVGLDVELDVRLIEEGVVREFIRKINGLRKNKGLTIEDRAEVYYFLERGYDLDKYLESIFKKNESKILKDTISTKIIKSDKELLNEIEVGGKTLYIDIRKKP